MSNFLNALANGSFQARLNEGSRLRTRLATLADQESGGDHQMYAQLLMGPGKMFDYGEFERSIRLQGLAGSAELERIRREIADLPRLPRPSNRKPTQTGGRKRRATKKARRKNRRLSRRNK